MKKKKRNIFFSFTKKELIVFLIVLLIFSFLPVFNCKHTVAYVEPVEGSDGGPIERDVNSPFWLLFIGGYNKVHSCSNLYLIPILIVVAYLLAKLVFIWKK